MNPDKSRIHVVSSVERALYIIDSGTDKVIEKISDLPENPEEVAITPDGKKACIVHRNPDPTQNSQMTILHLEKKQINIKNQKWWKNKSTKKDFKEYREEWVVDLGKDPRAIVISEIKDDAQTLCIAFIANYGSQDVTYVDVNDPVTGLKGNVPVQDHPHI
jgi:YVTN family beta-propeller protein